MRFQQRNNDDRVFTALGFMHGNRVGRLKLIQVRKPIDDKASIHFDADQTLLDFVKGKLEFEYEPAKLELNDGKRSNCLFRPQI